MKEISPNIKIWQTYIQIRTYILSIIFGTFELFHKKKKRWVKYKFTQLV